MDATIRHSGPSERRSVTFIEPGPWEPGDAETAIIAARLIPRVWQHAWVPEFAVVVLTGPRFGALTDHDRDLIWRRWGVPVYEYLTDSTGELIARECDAHEGLHVCGNGACDGLVIDRDCGCGVTGPMIVREVPAHVAAA